MEKIKEKLKAITLKQWHIGIIVAGILFIALGAFHNNIWFDESYSVGLARHTFGEIWSIGGHDVHPILYYWMLRIVYVITGGSIMAYRIFSVIPSAILIILGYTHLIKNFREKKKKGNNIYYFIWSNTSISIFAMASKFCNTIEQCFKWILDRIFVSTNTNGITKLSISRIY